jgi:hypothetical protein
VSNAGARLVARLWPATVCTACGCARVAAGCVHTVRVTSFGLHRADFCVARNCALECPQVVVEMRGSEVMLSCLRGCGEVVTDALAHHQHYANYTFFCSAHPTRAMRIDTTQSCNVVVLVAVVCECEQCTRVDHCTRHSVSMQRHDWYESSGRPISHKRARKMISCCASAPPGSAGFRPHGRGAEPLRCHQARAQRSGRRPGDGTLDVTKWASYKIQTFQRGHS